MDTAGVVSARLYREQCVNWGGMYVKDLTVVANRSLREMVLVDNSVHSFSFQLNNGIPVSSYYNNKEDTELLRLISYLEQIVKLKDVRSANKKAFMLSRLFQMDLDALHEELTGASLS